MRTARPTHRAPHRSPTLGHAAHRTLFFMTTPTSVGEPTGQGHFARGRNAGCGCSER